MTNIKKNGFSFESNCIIRYDHPSILSGQGTLGLEILEQVPDLDAIVIPVGGGGLLAGTAIAIKVLRPNVQIIVSKNYKLPTNVDTYVQD